MSKRGAAGDSVVIGRFWSLATLVTKWTRRAWDPLRSYREAMPTPVPPLTADELAELDRLALDGDPDAPLPDGAAPWHPSGDPAGPGLLPDWYMPAPSGGPVRGWRRAVAWLVVGSALAVVASGLCNTYGELVVA